MFLAKDKIQNSVSRALENKWMDENKKFIGFMDEFYYAPTRFEFEQYIYHNPIVVMPGDPIAGTEGFDCDDFAFVLKGNVSLFNRNSAHKPHSWAVGMIWGEFAWVKEYHVTNWIFTRDKGLFLVEPQNGRLEDFSLCRGKVTLVIL